MDVATVAEGFRKIAHQVYEVGEHTIEWLEGSTSFTLNGHQIWESEVEELLAALTHVAALMGGKGSAE